MHLIDILDPRLSLRLGLVLLHFLWQGFVLAGVVLVGIRLSRLQPGRPRYAAYLVALAMIAACPVATFFWIAQPAAPRVAPVNVASTTHDYGHSLPPSEVEMESLPHVAFSPAPAPTPSPVPITLAMRLSDLMDTVRTCARLGAPYLSTIWLAGVVVLSLRLLMGAAWLWRLRRRGIQPPDALVPLAHALIDKLGLSRRIRLLVIPGPGVGAANGTGGGSGLHIDLPIAFGCLRPVVLLPAAMVAGMPLELLEAVIAHELAHIRRLDVWVILIQRIIETLLFYHPAVWWVSSQLSQQRELCADELAIHVTGRRLDYARALELAAKSAGSKAAPPRGALAGGRWVGR